MQLIFNSMEEVIQFAMGYCGLAPKGIDVDGDIIRNCVANYLSIVTETDIKWFKDFVLTSRGKIPAIKEVRHKYGLGLKGAKEICDALQDRFCLWPHP